MTWYAKMNIHCKYDSLVEVDSLKPHPKNRNKHPQDQVERLAKILKYQGVRAPIVVSNRSNKIVKGHGTLQAIKANQWDKAPVVYQDFEDDDQEWLFVQSDNAIASWAELDLKGINADIGELGPFDIDLIGIKDFVVEPAEKDLGDEEATPEIRETDIKLGDLFILGDHRLLCGDSTDAAQVERLMNGEKADMVFTDPPYGDGHAAMEVNLNRAKLGKSIVSKQHFLKSDENLDFLPKSIQAISNFLKEKSTKLMFFKWSKWEMIKQSTKTWGEPSAVCVWDREKIAAATFRFNPVHEFCFHWGNQSDKKNTSNLTNVWREPKELQNKQLHPTVKPQSILIPVIEVCTTQKNIILDIFGGSGSTLIACEKTNRKCFMMELDPQYCQVIIDRWEQYTGNKAVKHG